MATFTRTPVPAYWLGSSPTPVTLELQTDFDLDMVTSTEAILAAPDGTELVGVTAVVTPDATDPGAGSVDITFPASPFAIPGRYQVRLRLVAGVHTEIVEPVPVIVQAPSGWLTLDEARDLWPQAPQDDAVLAMLLASALEACVEYLKSPFETVDEWFARALPVKDPWRQAQFQQSRSTWLAMSATMDSQVGDEGFQVTVFPLDWNVKQLLRPRGAPAMY